MKKRPLCMLCLCIIIAQVLLVVTGVRSMTPVTSFLEENIKGSVQLSGQVYRKELQSNYQILYLKDAEISHQNQKISQLKIVLYDETFADAALGNTVLASGDYIPFELPRNPGNFNQKFYYEKQEIAMAVWGTRIDQVSGEVWRVREYLSELRSKWHMMLCQQLGEKNGGMLSAMMLGERSDLDQEWKELYQVNGIGHLLAISGLHVSFVGLAVYQLLRKMGLSYGKAGILGIALLILYAMMTGLSVSTLRALIMFTIRMGADMVGRVYDMCTSLFVAAAIIVCWRPLYICDAGFLLSFGAILGILVMYPFLRKLISYQSKWVDGLCASLSIQIFLFPVTLYFFFEIPLYSILLNLIVIPLMSYLLGIGFAGSMLWWMIPPVGTVVLKSSAVIFEIYDWLCLRAVKLPSSRLVVGQPKWWQVVLCYIFMLMFLYFMGEKISKREQNGEKIQKSGVILILIVIMLISVPWHLDRDKLHITMLDVGQGDGIFVKGPTGVIYFVDGGSSDVKNVGKYRIEPFLKSQGVGTIDYVFISHGDADHMNGIEEMLKRQQVGIRLKYLVLPEKKFWDENLSALAGTALQQGTQVLVIKEGEQIVEDGFSITCVLPQRAYSGEVGNASSMVLLLKYGSFDMLLTGDVEGEGEEVLESVGFPGGVDVLKVAHHGSKNSTSEEILKRLKPRIGLISAGIGNRYGHPNKETLERLKKNGVEIYNTQECGCIQLETDGVEMKKGTYFKFPIIVSTAFSTFSLQVARFTRTNVPKRSPPNQSP